MVTNLAVQNSKHIADAVISSWGEHKAKSCNYLACEQAFGRAGWGEGKAC